jgi:glucose-1-phosphate adenylyltransferase
MDLVDVDPVFNLYNESWPIYTHALNYPPAKFVFADRENNRVGSSTDSLVSEGCIISGGHVHRSVLSPRVRVNSFSEVFSSRTCRSAAVARFGGRSSTRTSTFRPA